MATIGSILDEFGFLPFNSSRGALLIHLVGELYKRTKVVITANLSVYGRTNVFAGVKMTTARLKRLTHSSHILGTGNESCRDKACLHAAKKRERKRPQHDHCDIIKVR